MFDIIPPEEIQTSEILGINYWIMKLSHIIHNVFHALKNIVKQ